MTRHVDDQVTFAGFEPYPGIDTDDSSVFTPTRASKLICVNYLPDVGPIDVEPIELLVDDRFTAGVPVVERTVCKVPEQWNRGKDQNCQRPEHPDLPRTWRVEFDCTY